MMRQRRRVTQVCTRCGVTYSARADQAATQRYCSRQCKVPPVEERFWAMVERKEPEACWLWKGTTRAGYGLMSVNGRSENAHRVSLALASGPIPEGLDVLHTCDNPSCVNPAHLFIGTHSDNMRDMVAKRRNNHPAKLTVAQVLDIRRSTAGPAELAKQYGVSPSNISNLRAGRTWKREMAHA